MRHRIACRCPACHDNAPSPYHRIGLRFRLPASVLQSQAHWFPFALPLVVETAQEIDITIRSTRLISYCFDRVVDRGQSDGPAVEPLTHVRGSHDEPILTTQFQHYLDV